MKDNKHILNWKEHVLKAADALREDDRDRYEKEMELINEAYEEYKRDNDLSYSCEKSFGAAREIFENALPTLFVNNKKIVRKILGAIKEDKNLLAQFMFLESLKKYRTEFDIKKYLTESCDLVKKHINPKTIKESNKKFYSILRENNIKPVDYLDEGKLSFYRDCDTLLTEKRTLANISSLNETYNRVADYVEKEAKNREEAPSKKDIVSVKEFTEKLNANLTESEKEIIINLLYKDNENKRKKMFENYKNECLKKIKKTLNESEGDEKIRLNSLYNAVSNKTYNKDTIFEEMLKMVEVINIFND